MKSQLLQRLGRRSVVLLAAIFAVAGGSNAVQAQQNIVQPGDAVIASSPNSPGSEGVANAIDGTQTKYLNFDLDNDAAGGPKPAGFVVTPSVGVTRVVGMAIQSANDAPDRDPKVVTLEGSNDDAIDAFGSGTWELIARVDNIPSWTSVFGDVAADNRYKTQTFTFANLKAYKHYRWTVLETQGPSTCCMQVAEVQLLGGLLPGDITQPSDAIIASSANSPGSEGVANVIDGTQTKYLNFDLDNDAAGGPKPAGYVVTPGIGATLVTGMTIQSANDAPDRDPKVVTLEGSNDDEVTSFSGGSWELITRLDNIPSWTSVFGDVAADNRYQVQTFLFDNVKPYKHYRWTVLETQGPSTCCMQVAEVELLGTGAPQDITQPGDAIIASSANSPGSEGVANAIDGTQTKYLNFDLDNDAAGGPKPAGFVVTPALGATTVIGMTLQSANDAPDRDPKVVTLEGSNDDEVSSFSGGTWELIARLDNIPSWTSVFGDVAADNRYQVQSFYFQNAKSYKHYRWTVLETQGPSTCCMQIAEVELLAVTQGADCNKARFLVQPVDTSVLLGSQATFFTTVNGPWPLQWSKNGQPIPGANTPTYTTEAMTADGATNVYTVEIVGCEVSNPAKPVLFTPSTTKSIGITFRGGGANGAPTLMNADDIAGIFPQAYWNNAANSGTGFLPDTGVDPVIDLVDSDNNPSSILVDFTTSGTWGSGSGDTSATARMLNGLNYANPGTAATITFQNVPAGNHTVIAYMVGIPLQFQDANYSVIGASTETYYVRVINADEYNAAPGFYRGISKDANNRSLATYVRFDNVRPDAGGNLTLSWDTITTGFDRGAPVNALQLVLNAPAAGAPPAITAQPQPAIAPEGGVAVLSVTATGDNLTYQWRKNGRNLPDGGNISGATTATLTIRDFSAEDDAIYNVAVFNPAGSVVSRNAAVHLSQYEIADALVGYWKFDETTGSSAANSAAGGKPGAVTGTSSWGAGRVGNAFGFDGQSYLFVTDYPVATRKLSVAGWARINASGSDMVFIRNAQGQIGIGAGRAPNTPAGQFEFGLVTDQNTGNALLSAAIGAGPNILRATAGTAFPIGSWHHVAFTADGAQLRLYIDGAEVGFTDYSGNINPPEIRYLSIGARLNADEANGLPLGPDESTPNFLAGQLDDLGVWTRALSREEIQKITAAGNQGQPLTSVVLEPPAQGGTLGIAVSGANITITWDAGRLQSAPAATGPWTDVVGTSPFTDAASGAARFFRTVSP